MSEIAYYVAGDIACSIHKHGTLGNLYGYIGLPPNHPWHGKHYNDIGADVHGGLTWCGPEKASISISPERREYLSAHVGKGDWNSEEYDALPRWEVIDHEWAFPHDTGLDLWWVGFDCAHLGDLTPSMPPHPGDIYRDEADVRNEIEGLVQQATMAAQREVKSSANTP